MKNTCEFCRNFIRLGGWFRKYYLYVDLFTNDTYVADSLICRHRVPVKYYGEYERDGDKYELVVCAVRNKHRKAFEEAMGEIATKMSLLGHNDYEDYCRRLKAEFSGGD